MLRDQIKNYYDNGFYSKENVSTFVEIGVISIDDYNLIISGNNIPNYEMAYNELTSGSLLTPTILRARVQALCVGAESTAIVNAEPFIETWSPGSTEKPTHYVQNMPYRYNGQVYKCNQTHDNHGEVGHEPDKSQALFSIAHTKDKTNPKPFVQPTGSHDAYMRDECCLFEIDGVMKLCTSKANNNVYSPTDYAQYWTIEEWNKK